MCPRVPEKTPTDYSFVPSFDFLIWESCHFPVSTGPGTTTQGVRSGG